METMAIPLVSLFIGSLITWLLSKHYYLKASKDLRHEVQQLRQLNQLMLLGMEHAGWIELSRDRAGNIIGFRQTIGVPGIPSGEEFGNPRIIMGPSKKKS